jgi:tetratricopeptide (TPR) repeat protein
VLAKAIYLLSEREVKAQLPKDVFLTLKTMSLNNLSCIYKSQGKLQNALSSINEALEVEQKMLTEGLPTSQERIITTIINKAVVMSAMGKNKQAVALLKDSFKYIPV